MISPEMCRHLNWSLSRIELEDEKLGFVKDGWLTLIIKVTHSSGETGIRLNDQP